VSELKEPLFNQRVLRLLVERETASGVAPSDLARQRMLHWIEQLERGALDRVSESTAEQTFNSEIFGTVLGYTQLGQAVEHTLLPKRTGSSGRDTPDFVLGHFDLTAGREEWLAVGEIKNSRTDLDQPQLSRANKETPVEQGFRYATKGRPGVEWVIVTNFREIRLYKNGYINAFHSWQLSELVDEQKFQEFFCILGPDGLLGTVREPLAIRVFRESVYAGKNLKEGFYGLYKLVQQALVDHLQGQSASAGMSVADLFGKAHKLLNRILFVAFCEDHPAALVPRQTLRQVVQRARADGAEGAFWREYRSLFTLLNVGGGLNGAAINAFNGGLFAPDAYFDQVQLPNALFERRFQAGRGRSASQQITGIFGFDTYDFAEDLNAQALGAIFEQSLKDIRKRPSRVRGVGETDLTDREAGGVYYTPREITSYLVGRAFDAALADLQTRAAERVTADDVHRRRALTANQRIGAHYAALSELLRDFKVIDPACGSGAFLVEAFDQLHDEYDKINRAISGAQGRPGQASMLDLDRRILRENLFGLDLLPESVEISRLSIWLRTARPGERLETLDATIRTGDSLRAGDVASFDVVVGNPPWGADIDGWTEDELLRRFPFCGEEKDSYAIFVMRAWELLKPGGILAFVLPNSWLTVLGYESFRSWLLKHFDIIEVNNVWKVFADVNHDAVLLMARKRQDPLTDEEAAAHNYDIRVRAVSRGLSEAAKLQRLAESGWWIDHTVEQSFMWRQPRHRFEVIYEPRVADAMDRIGQRCRPLGECASTTVGIQVYHHTRVDAETIKTRAFHSTMRRGSDWHPYIEANDVQRYVARSSDTKWLLYSDRLCDKRELAHYAQPRILVQQIFWQRMSAVMQEPTEPYLYLNTLFAVYETDIPLACILAILNSRFISASYERRANRLFGDKFPKVSKADLAAVPIPHLTRGLKTGLRDTGVSLQRLWGELRDGLRDADRLLRLANSGLAIEAFPEFWLASEDEFVTAALAKTGLMSGPQADLVRQGYRAGKSAVDSKWHEIEALEIANETLVSQAYRVPSAIYQQLLQTVPAPEVSWALR
jgi:SAM-dependent methyltransferase